MLVQHSGGSAGTAGYYMNNRVAVLVHQSTIGAFGWLCWYSRVLLENPGGCARKQSTIGTFGRLCWYRRVLQEHWGLYCYRRVLQEHWRGCAGTAE